VLVEVEGSGAEVERFVVRLAAEAPPLAVVERIRRDVVPVSGEPGFRIVASVSGGPANAPISPDTAVCPDCLRELLDPGDRRFRYPFINCTNCGPRFTIVTGIPYDRPLTTMAGFQMCERCRGEYLDPADRRFHAQPNACPECGPSLSVDPPLSGEPPLSGAPPPDGARDAVRAVADALLQGAIAAVKGVGGYHLACRADDESAVAALRARKHREDKPFALMAADPAGAERLVWLGPAERQLLTSPERPIVLAPRRADAPVAPSVAPGAPELGVMLPYTPLHHLLARDVGEALVMTSGNVSDEPIAYRDEDARERLSRVADLFLTHDRPIETRTDDSVLRLVSIGGERRRSFLRRSRGYVPASLPLPGGGARAPLLACGAELKSTFCVAKGERAWVSHHIGDLENYETLRSFREGIDHFERLFEVRPEVVVHDLHPQYLSTQYALERDGVELLGVQHHHAHLAACLAEHDELGSAVGAIFDGTGYGTDGTVWGGEILCGSVHACSRVGSLLPVPLPGGARAIREPWRMACAWLAETEGEEAEPPPGLAGLVAPGLWRAVARLSRSGLSSPWTTSMGRLFDAVAALCGVRATINYEGQAAIELEACCDPHEAGRYPMNLIERDGLTVIDPREMITAIVADLASGVTPGMVAARFHAAIAGVTVEACALAAARCATDRVVLSGGVFANRRLLEAAAGGLHAAGLRVLVPERLPVNDGGISYGQAAVAAARTAA
jgi:hydrogenase maturation protein HypF